MNSLAFVASAFAVMQSQKIVIPTEIRDRNKNTFLHMVRAENLDFCTALKAIPHVGA